MNLYQPIWKEVNYSLTPQDAYLALGSSEDSFILESAKFHPKTGRYSFVGIEPFLIFRSKGNHIEVSNQKPVTRNQKKYGNPIQELRKIFSQYKSAKISGLPNFTGGAVGYFSYDVGRMFENLPALQEDDLKLWDIYLAFYDTVVAFDHFENKTIIISNANLKDNSRHRAYREAQEKVERIEERLYNASAFAPRSISDDWASADSPPKPWRRRTDTHRCHCEPKAKQSLEIASGFALATSPALESNLTREGFEEMVMTAKHYIREGDIYQANLSQRLSLYLDIDAFYLYKTLTDINPSPFASYIHFQDIKLVSCSPERLLKLEGNNVQTRPIAGTRPRGQDPNDDLAKSLELILSEKERAEHIMLLDLERNDLGRVCEFGSVRVDELMVEEYYSHVIHIVSNVIGTLRKDKDRFDLLAAAFPGGTITGAPKVRCMQIIEELEPVQRGIYTGSIGYIAFNGDMDLNIAIRTMLVKKNKAFIQVGSGIVADSDPAKEYYETLYKAEALIEAVRRAMATQPARV